MGCGGSKTTAAGPPANTTSNPVHPVHQSSMNAGELVTAAALKAKRRANVMAEAQEVSEPYVPRNIPKDERTRALLGAALRENVLFASLGAQEVQEMINAMEPVEYKAGAEVIKQGAVMFRHGASFSVISAWYCDIYSNLCILRGLVSVFLRLPS
jgi:hypothetical protein